MTRISLPKNDFPLLLGVASMALWGTVTLPATAGATAVAPAVTEIAQADPLVAEAVSTFRSYVGHVRAQDEAAARRLWHPDDDQFPIYDWPLGYVNWTAENINLYNDSLVAARRVEDRVELDVTWTLDTPRASGRTFTYHLVRSGDTMVGISPLKLFTADWHAERVGKLVAHWRPDREIDREALSELARDYEAALRELELEPPRDLHFFLCETPEEVGRLFSAPPSPGLAHLRNAVVAITNEFSLHEAVHVLMQWLDPEDNEGRALRPVAEATAHCLGGGTWLSKRCLLSWAAQIYGSGGGQPLGPVLRGLSSNDLTDTAAEAAAVIRYLLDEGGGTAFRALYRNSTAWPTVGDAIIKAYGEPWTDIEPRFRETIPVRYPPLINGGRLPDAEVVYEHGDPTGDDHGDGDYVYPVALDVTAGAFDLTRFRVTRTRERIGFEIETAALPDREGSPWSFSGTFVRIGVDRGGERYRVQDLGPGSRVTLADGVDLLIDAGPDGVLVRSARGQWLDVLRIPAPGETLRDGNTIVFSLPIDLIGDPAADSWRYQVSTGYHTQSLTVAGGVGGFTAVAPEARGGTGGGGDPQGFSPNVYDVLTPPGAEQAALLSAYNADREQHAKLPLVP